MAELFAPDAPAVALPVTLVGPRRSAELRCTLDTGSALTVVPTAFLRRLGVDLSRPTGRVRLRSATGHVLVPVVTVGAISALGRVRTDFVVAAHDLPVGVSADGLLGWTSFAGSC